MRLLFKLESRAGHPRQRVNDVKDKKVCGMQSNNLLTPTCPALLAKYVQLDKDHFE